MKPKKTVIFSIRPRSSPASTKTNLLQYSIMEQDGKLSGDSNFAAVEKEQFGSNLKECYHAHLSTIFNSNKVYYLILCINKNNYKLMPINWIWLIRMVKKKISLGKSTTHSKNTFKNLQILTFFAVMSNCIRFKILESH